MSAASFGSQQLRLFRRAMRDGHLIEEAAALADMSIGEARLHAADDAANPPPPAAYELLINPDARAAASQAKEPEMAKEDEEGAKEYKRPDAAKAFEIFDKQIAPKLTHMATLKGDLSQPYGDIKEHAHFPRKVLNFIVDLENMDDDAKRDHFLLALADGLKHRKLFLPRDLVTMANGEAGGDIVGAEDRDNTGDLATLSDDDDDDFEANERELAAQRDRPSAEAAKAKADADSEAPPAGTGAAAIAAMNKTVRKPKGVAATAH